MEMLLEIDFEFTDNTFIANYFEEKIRIMTIYNSELREHLFLRNVEGIETLVKFRGVSEGNKYAEVFKIIKFIN